MENDLADHINQLADMFHGLSVSGCCSLAYKVAKRNSLDVPISWDRDKAAGLVFVRCQEASEPGNTKS